MTRTTKVDVTYVLHFGLRERLGDFFVSIDATPLMDQLERADLEAKLKVELEKAAAIKAEAKAAAPKRHNGPFLPQNAVPDLKSYDGIDRAIKSCRETGFLPGNNMAAGARPKNVMYFSEVVKMMLGWPEQMVIDVLKDPTQAVLARGAAAQCLLYLKGDDAAVDRVLDRTDGPVSRITQQVNQNFLSVNDGATQISADAVKAAFDAVSARKKGLVGETEPKT